ncbi:MAG: PAS domain-containing protein [Candidatus Latescibacterota bacterium]|jgi:PAS domain-containing protein
MNGKMSESEAIMVEITATYVCYGGEEYYYSLARDLREKKQIEESLLFERHLMQTLLDHIPDIIYFKDRDARFVRVSRSLEQLTHTTSGSL